jgi:hypothetical protein
VASYLSRRFLLFEIGRTLRNSIEPASSRQHPRFVIFNASALDPRQACSVPNLSSIEMTCRLVSAPLRLVRTSVIPSSEGGLARDSVDPE